MVLNVPQSLRTMEYRRVCSKGHHWEYIRSYCLRCKVCGTDRDAKPLVSVVGFKNGV